MQRKKSFLKHKHLQLQQRSLWKIYYSVFYHNTTLLVQTFHYAYILLHWESALLMDTFSLTSALFFPIAWFLILFHTVKGLCYTTEGHRPPTVWATALPTSEYVACLYPCCTGFEWRWFSEMGQFSSWGWGSDWQQRWASNGHSTAFGDQTHLAR